MTYLFNKNLFCTHYFFEAQFQAFYVQFGSPRHSFSLALVQRHVAAAGRGQLIQERPEVSVYICPVRTNEFIHLTQTFVLKVKRGSQYKLQKNKYHSINETLLVVSDYPQILRLSFKV